MLNEILALGPKLEALEFTPTLCEELLTSIDINCDLEHFNKELAQWLLSEKLPKQLNVYNTFGQPPVTLFNNDKFVVDLYFWMHADTSLHSHAFKGAFKVLFGQSLHEEFAIKTKKEHAFDVRINELTRTNSEILNPQDVRQISSGDSFNHRVVHLSSPTVTLCIRTVKDLTIPQWHHFDNGLSILKRELDESIFKKMLYGDYLAKTDITHATKFTKEFIQGIDLSEAMNLFEQLTVDTMGIDEEYQVILYDVMMKRLNNTNWFKIYEEYCSKEIIEPEDDSPEAKLIAHMNNFSYAQEEAGPLFTQLV